MRSNTAWISERICSMTVTYPALPQGRVGDLPDCPTVSWSSRWGNDDSALTSARLD